jgi:hypothetical protein
MTNLALGKRVKSQKAIILKISKELLIEIQCLPASQKKK